MTVTEEEIFADLSALCSSPGYIHAIAYLCFRDTVGNSNIIMENAGLNFPSAMEKLIRTEITTLIGLMIKNEINYKVPTRIILNEYVKNTDSLLRKLHDSIILKMINENRLAKNDFAFLKSGESVRESVFYATESAYPFQYRDFATRKYESDNEWLIRNKNFSIEQATRVLHAIEKIFNKKINIQSYLLESARSANWSLLFTFTTQDVARFSELAMPLVDRVLKAFTLLPAEEKNHSFNSIGDINVVHNQSPLIKISCNKFILFQLYSLMESLYETPYYWMAKDESYCNTAAQNRGKFPEKFTEERLEFVFGKENVYRNVNILDGKKKNVGEIDVLVVFGDRAIVVQAKSKRMTLKARSGDGKQVLDDFQKSIKKSYEQGFKCAKFIVGGKHKLQANDFNEIVINRDIKEIYIFCIVADHYPALCMQANQFLKYEKSDIVYPPFVMDIFTLDVMVDMLSSPLRLLSYVNRRTTYFGSIRANHEIAILAHHIKENLWLDDESNTVRLDDSIATELNMTMFARREGVSNDKVPKGILTHFVDTHCWHIIEGIERNPNPSTINLGFFLLTLGSKPVNKINGCIEKMTTLAMQDFKHHDFSIGFSESSTGITFHCNNLPFARSSVIKLQNDCEIRKYACKAKSWFGIFISPDSALPKFGIELNYQWEYDAEMEEIAKTFTTHKM